MDINEFWNLIERSGRDASKDNPDGNMDRFVANLKKLLLGPARALSAALGPVHA